MVRSYPFVANHLLKKVEKLNLKARKKLFEHGHDLQQLFPL